jgi:Asp-tRNA(Asn)/Glu-tRNA(Gln) amidotransferase A subunit family amidase
MLKATILFAVGPCASVLIGLPAMAQAPAEVTLTRIDCGTGATPTDVGQRFTDTFAWNRDEQGAEGVRGVLGSVLYSYAMNLMGLPAAIVPANENDAQPVGVQIVGRRFREDMILDAAEAVEQAVGVMAEQL